MKAAIKKRTAPKEERQQQLIQATIRSVARNGLSDTTMATVSREAGLSQGIINLHFQSKDRLLVETLRFLSEQYRSAWEKAIEKAGDAPADKLAAMVATDFKPPVCDRNKLAVWFAFWGESKSRPTYRRLCDEWDRYYDQVVAEQCELLIEAGGYKNVRADIVADAVAALTNGLWLSCLISPQTWDREDAIEAMMSYLRGTFPKHFN